MRHKLGIETEVDLECLVLAAQEAERIVAHPLPGQADPGFTPPSYCKAKAA